MVFKLCYNGSEPSVLPTANHSNTILACRSRLRLLQKASKLSSKLLHSKLLLMLKLLPHKLMTLVVYFAQLLVRCPRHTPPDLFS